MTAKSRKITIPALTILLGTLMGLGIVEIGLRYYVAYVRSQEKLDPGLLVFNPQTGWRMASRWKGRHRHHDFDVTYTTSDQGFRGPWPAPTPTVPRYGFLGDSFTFGLGVEDSETFVQRLGIADSSKIYLNAGVAGFSTDQEYLLLKERLPQWRLDKLALVVYLANDLLDNTLRYPLQATMGKPLFTLQSDELKLTNVPVPLEAKPAEEQQRTLRTFLMGEEEAQRQTGSWRNSWQIARSLGLDEHADSGSLARMSNRLAYPVDLFVRLIQEMHHFCENNNVAMSIILMPGRSYVELPGSLSAQFQESLRLEILRRESQLGVPVVDLASDLRQEYQRRQRRLFHPNEGHLSADGHQVVADLLLHRLK